MSPKITTPVKGFTGTVVGVDFKNGEGETEDLAAIAYFERQGYTVEAEEKAKEPTERELLVAEAKELGIEAKGKVDELKKRIADHKAKTAAPAADPQSPPADGDEGKEQS